MKFSFNYIFLMKCGFQLGGNIKRSYLRNSSVVYAQKNFNFIVKISLTSLQLKKSIKLMARYVKRRATLYFVHSHFGFQLLMKQLFAKTNVFYLSFKPYKHSKLKNKRYIVRCLKKMYFISQWKPGFLTNRLEFLVTTLNRKVQIRFPKYGFLNDYKTNFVCLKEFKYAKIPYSSLINLNVSNSHQGCFDIPGNGVSYDTFFLT